MKKLFSSFYLWLIIGSLSAALVSCKDDDGPGDEPEPTQKMTITNIDPLTAREGDTVRITGTGFSKTPSQNTVLFNQSTSAQVIAAADTELKVKVPMGAPSGPIKVTVGEASAVSTQTFTLDVSLGVPTITAIAPTHGLAGSELNITGTNLVEGSVIAKVSFGTTVAEVTASSATSLKVKVPASLAEGEFDVRVDRGGKVSNVVKFVVDPLPKTVKATYWTDGLAIYKGTITETGVDIKRIYDSENGGLLSTYGIAFNPTDNKVYFAGGSSEYPDGAIFRAPADGSGPIEQLYTFTALGGDFPASDIALDAANNNLYVTALSRRKDRIIKGHYADLNEPVKVLYEITESGRGNAIGIKLTVANGKLYWAQSVSMKVVEGSLDGSEEAKVLFDGDDNLAAPYNIAVDVAQQKIFILDNPEEGATATDAIYAGNLDGTGSLTKIISAGDDLDGGFDVEVDIENQFVIWLSPLTEGQGQKVSRCKYDGTDVETLFSSDQIQGAGFFDIDVR